MPVEYNDEVTEEQVRRIDAMLRDEFEQEDWQIVEQECAGGNSSN